MACETSFRYLYYYALHPVGMSDKLREFDEARDQGKGQIDPRAMLGLFVVIVIGGPLVKVALDIQSSLASTSTFTPLTAAVIALLIVAAVIAAILAPE